MLRILKNSLSKDIFSIRTSIRTLSSEVSTIQTTGATTETQPSKTDDELVDIPNPFEQEKQKCILCRLNMTPNYKNVKLLSQFQSPYTGRIYGRHITGLCKKQQELVEKEIVKAQNCALMPTYHKIVDFLHDPKLFNPEKPIRPHKY